MSVVVSSMQNNACIIISSILKHFYSFKKDAGWDEMIKRKLEDNMWWIFKRAVYYTCNKKMNKAFKNKGKDSNRLTLILLKELLWKRLKKLCTLKYTRRAYARLTQN